MSIMEVITAIAAVMVASFVYMYLKFQWSYQYWKKKNVPYFEPRFPWGNLEVANKNLPPGSDVITLTKTAYSEGWKYFGIYQNSKPTFIPLDLDLVKAIMSKDFNHFTDRGAYVDEEYEPLSGHLFGLGGASWRNMRVKLTPTFTSGKLRQMFQTIVDCGEILEAVIKEHGKEPVDIRNALSCYTTDVIGSCAFGLECNSFKNPDSQFLKYGKRVFSPERGWLKLITIIVKAFFLRTFPKLAKAVNMKLFPEDLTNFYFDVVTQTVDYREKSNYSRNDFLQLLINMKNKKNDQQDEKSGNSSSLTMNQLVAQCFVFFLAGYETSSTTMTFAFYELATHPKIQEKVRKEILDVLKKYDNKVCYDALKEMEYLQQVIDETLRKYPPLQFITRECVQDYKVPDTDVIIEKGTGIIIPIANIHYMDCHYENPEEFDPDRFSQAEKETRHPFAHIPFGEGPRLCIGMRFGLMQTKVGLVSVLRNYRVQLNPKTQTPIKMDTVSSTPSIAGGLWLDMEKIVC